MGEGDEEGGGSFCWAAHTKAKDGAVSLYLHWLAHDLAGDGQLNEGGGVDAGEGHSLEGQLTIVQDSHPGRKDGRCQLHDIWACKSSQAIHGPPTARAARAAGAAGHNGTGSSMQEQHQQRMVSTKEVNGTRGGVPLKW